MMMQKLNGGSYIMSDIWFTSDTHYGHKNICRGTTEWKDNPSESSIHSPQSTRDFKTLEDMNKAIVDGINKYVDKYDELWHLGDLVFGGIDNIWKFRPQIKCLKVNIVFGNHDYHLEHNKILPNCIYTGKEDDPYGEIGLIIDGKPSRIEERVGATELFKTSTYYKHLSINQQEFILSHYAMRVWNRSHHGSIMLYGHSHDSLDRGGEIWGKSMDVGIDSAFRLFGEYRPFSLEEILGIMRKRDTLIIDHHNKNTN